MLSNMSNAITSIPNHVSITNPIESTMVSIDFVFSMHNLKHFSATFDNSAVMTIIKITAMINAIAVNVVIDQLPPKIRDTPQ